MSARAVTFDLWETLIADSPELNQKRTQARVRQTALILKEAGFDCEEGQIDKAHSLVWEECSRSWERALDLPFGRQVEMFLDLISPGLGSSLPRHQFEEVSQAYARAVLLYPPLPISGAGETLDWLRTRGYRLGLICNTGRSPGWVLRELLTRFRLLHYFDTVLFSDETIVRKPNPSLFLRALSEMKASALETTHVGDSWENDIQGALSAGMSVVWIGGDPRKTSLPCLSSVADLPKLMPPSV